MQPLCPHPNVQRSRDTERHRQTQTWIYNNVFFSFSQTTPGHDRRRRCQCWYYVLRPLTSSSSPAPAAYPDRAETKENSSCWGITGGCEVAAEQLVIRVPGLGFRVRWIDALVSKGVLDRHIPPTAFASRGLVVSDRLVLESPDPARSAGWSHCLNIPC